MRDHVELVVVVRLGNAADEVVELRDRPAVEREHILRCDEVRGVKAVEVAEAVACGVAELEIVLRQLLEDLLGAAHIGVVVGAARPQTQHVGAELVDDLGRIHAVAEGLVHGLALTVDRPAVGQALAVRSALAERADGHEQGRLEPAAVLVAALDIHIRRPEALVALHGGDVGRAGVEPAVKGIGLLREVLAAAVRAGEALGQDVGRRAVEPGVAAFLFKELGHCLDALLGADGLVAVVAVEHRDRQAPAALTGDAPVGALADHGGHALLAPHGQPAHVLARGDSVLLEGVHGAEPLRRGAEDDRALAAPAVRIAVHDVLGCEERAGRLHVCEDDGVRFLRGHAGVLAGVVGVAALIVHGHDHVHAVALAGQVVVGAETGRGVHAAGAGIHGDVVCQHQTRGLGQEGVVGEHVLKEFARVLLEHLVAVKAADVHDLLGQRVGHDVHLAVGRLDEVVQFARVERDGEVAGQGPDRGRPDDEKELAVVDVRQLAEVVVHRELHVHGRARIVLILDLCLGEGGLVVGAPVHRLEPLVDVAVAVHLAEHAHLFGLKALVHGLVGVLPVGDDAHALEAVHLAVDVFLRIVVAGAAEVGDAHGLVVELLLLDDGALDGHAVVVPAGNVGRVVAAHGVGADDEVLERLVERVAHVDVAVGERRAVVQAEARLAVVLFEHFVIQIHVVPAAEHIGLTLGEAGAHGEVCFRQVDRGVEIVLGHGKDRSPLRVVFR